MVKSKLSTTVNYPEHKKMNADDEDFEASVYDTDILGVPVVIAIGQPEDTFLKSDNIIYYPRRKNELTFKGDFWVADTTFALKNINMQASKSANINWVKEIYIEQDFEVLNDSVFLIKRDYFMSDFAFNKKEKSRGIYGKRTTLYDNYKFNEEKDPKFYKEKVYSFDEDIYNQDDSFWDKNRMESLSKDEKKTVDRSD